MRISPAVSETVGQIVATLTGLGDAVVVTALDGRIVLWSAAAESLLGWRASDVVGRSLIDLLEPTRADERAADTFPFLGEPQWQGEADVRQSAGGRVAVHVSLTRLALADSGAGECDGIVLRMRALATRAIPARADLLGPDLLEKALAHVEDIVLITAGLASETDGSQIVYVNEAFERTTGFLRDDVVGRSPAMLHGPDTDRAVSRRIDAAAEDRQRVREALLTYTKQGEPLWLDIDVIPIDVAGGRYTQWVAVERDVASQKGQEVALRAREERLRLALSAVWDGLWDWHVPTGYCFYAPRWFAMLGFSEHALPSHIDTFLDLLHPQDLAACEQLLRDHFDGRTDMYALEVRLRTADNAWRWVLTRGTVVERDVHGRPVRMIGTHTDIAERKQAELALRSSEDRFRTLAMAAPLGIFLTDFAGQCTFVTPRMRDLWGAPVDALMGKGFRDAAHPEDRSRVLTAWRNTVRAGGEVTLEYRVLRPDGGVRWVCERTAAHRDGTEVTGFVGTVEDITAQKVAADERQRLEAQMQHAQKLEVLGVLAGGIAHDFNNLLVGILGNASVARDEVEPGTLTEELLSDIETSARRAAELTKQLLAYAGKGQFNVERLDLSTTVRGTSSLLQTAISKRATLDLQLVDGLPPISADGQQVRQVVMNLLTNASDALEETTGDITLRTGRMMADAAYLAECLAADGVVPGEFVFVEVADTGIGMNEETLARVFDPFFTTKFTGRGLGLPATLGIVRGHGGALRVRSTIGSGTVFRVLFPAAKERAPAQRAAAATATDAVTRTGTILLVDDEESVREVARRILERGGFSVISARDGDDGLRLFAEHEGAIRAIVLDVTMPRRSGTEVLSELRRQGKTIPVVLASGYASESLAPSLNLSVAAPVFVQKPFVAGDLLAGIDAALAGGSAVRTQSD